MLPLQTAEVTALAVVVVVAGELVDGKRFPLCSSICTLLFCCAVSLGSASTTLGVLSFDAFFKDSYSYFLPTSNCSSLTSSIAGEEEFCKVALRSELEGTSLGVSLVVFSSSLTS